MAKLTLNFHDAARGVAIPGIDVEIQKIYAGSWKVLAQLSSDVNGDIAISAIDADDDLSGYYEATARIGNYFLDAGYVLPTLKFIDVLPIRFGVPDADTSVKLAVLITPYGYSLQAS